MNKKEPQEGKQVMLLDRSAMIKIALEKGSDLAELEKLFELQIKFEANEAKKAYHHAMAQFKEENVRVIKDLKNKQFGDSPYASEDALINTINPVLSKYGLNATFEFPKSDDPALLLTTCKITHEFGHSETVTIPAPIDTSGSKNAIQSIRSTVTYMRKVAFEAALGIATSKPGEDDNGNAAGTAYLTEEQIKIIEFLAEQTNKDVLKWRGVKSLSEIPAKDFKEIESALRAAKKKQREPGDE